jgi:hypothetical protein
LICHADFDLRLSWPCPLAGGSRASVVFEEAKAKAAIIRIDS